MIASVAAAILSIDVLLFTGLLDIESGAYSNESALRRQTTALADGRFALSAHPGDVGWDMVWNDGAVQQVWGLGVPMIRLPFELLARPLGLEYFPDRLVFGAALFCVAFIACLVFFNPNEYSSITELLKAEPASVCSLALILAFPPLISICCTRFLGYEEVAAYGYLTGTLLLVLTINASHRQSGWSTIAVSVVAGFAPFVRPTLLAYSVASVLIVGYRLAQKKCHWPKILLLTSPMPVMVGLLAESNRVRFGAALEFGHSLNLNTVNPMRLVSRFGSSFNAVSVPDAATELFSCLFLTNNYLNGREWYQDDFFPGQSDALRWREFYFTAFDVSYFILAALGWILGTSVLLTRPVVRSERSWTTAQTCLIWSWLTFPPLFLFYLRFPSVSSRYNLDFAPALCAAMIACLLLVEALAREYSLPRHKLAAVMYAAAAAWGIIQYRELRTLFPSITPISLQQAKSEMIPFRIDPRLRLAEVYGVGMTIETDSLPFNCAGWNTTDGSTKAAVVFWVDSPQGLEVSVRKRPNTQPSDFKTIRAKVGLEELRLISLAVDGEEAVLRFKGPSTPIYRTGLQVACLAMTSPRDAGVEDSAFELRRISWTRNNSEERISRPPGM